ncbi:hypothetical protein [Actinophytocola xanthii]|uniref:Uncharacterized protein n=1 Tax=Actinophytocola xanthii TaxID=1912961 RepID=A0A1Q8C2I2_9PSEU|nr:hypothetical protein [Actinophytocola xanthii]OLF08551.1 hypothetical protein BU204_34225 [Actinophytocola xanthii]
MSAIRFPVVQRTRQTLRDGDSEIEFEFELRVARRTSLLMARPVGGDHQAWRTWADWTTPPDDPVGAGEREASRYGVTGWQPVPRLPLTTSDVVALGAIVTGARRSARVSRALDYDAVSGTARAVVTDERGVFAGDRDDVRDCLLWVTLSSGFEAFWPVSDLVPEYQSSLFVLHNQT